MKLSLPNWMFLGGVGALAFSNESKQLSPEVLGRITVLHWSCALVAAFLFSMGLFLALYGLISQAAVRKRFILPCFCNLVFLIALPALHFFVYAISTKIYHLTDEVPNALPKMVDYAQSSDKEEGKRLKVAQVAYKLYGVKIAYRRDNGEFVRYEPSEQDVASYIDEKEAQKAVEKSKTVLKGVIDQQPYLFAFYLGAFFLTFFFGSLWVAFGKSKSASNLQS